MGTFDYLQSYSKVQLKLRDLLKDAGAILTDKETITKTVIKEKVDELTARLKNDGYEVLSGPRTTGDGYYESCILGIENNQIEITV